jgi:hypothetical protein
MRILKMALLALVCCALGACDPWSSPHTPHVNASAPATATR